MRLILAAAEDDVLSRARRAARRRPADRLLRRSRLRRQGEAVRRRARAALPDPGARAVRPRARRGDGLRHAGRRARPRRGARSRRRRRHRDACSTTSSRWSTGCRACFGLDRRRVRERAVARFGVDAHGRRVRRRLSADRRRRIVADAPRRCRRAVAGRTVLAVFAHPDDESLACGGTLARLADAGARVVVMCASRGERGSISDPALVPRRRPRRGPRRASCATPPRRSASPKSSSLDHPDGDLRWAHVPEFHARDRDAASTLPARPRSSRSAKTACTGTSITSASTSGRTRRVRSLGADAPPLYYVTMPQGVMRADRRRGARARLGAAADAGFWSLDARRVRHRAPSRRRSSSTSRDWVPRKLAAHPLPSDARWAPAIPFAWIDDARGPALARHRALPPRRSIADRASAAVARAPGEAASMHIDTLDILRCPYCGGPARARRPRCSTARSATRSTTASSAATAASSRSSTAFRCCTCCRRPIAAREHVEAGRPDLALPRDVRPRRRRAGRDGSRPPRRPRRRPTATSSRRSGRISRAATSSTASPIRPSSSPTPSSARWRGTVLRGTAARDRHLRRLRPPDAVAARPVVAAAGARRSVLREGLAGAPLHGARAASRSAATATRRCRSRAARSASRCARTRSCTSGPSGSSSARWCA